MHSTGHHRKTGDLHTQGMLDYDTNIVAGTTPGKGGQKFGEIDVYNSIAEAKGRWTSMHP